GFDFCPERVAHRAVTDGIAGEIEFASRKFSASVDEMLEPLECDKPANADDARPFKGRRRRFVVGRRKTFEIDPVVNAVNFRSGIRTAVAKKLTTVIGLSCDELRRSADFTKQVVTAEVLHEILPVRGDAEWNAGNFFQEKCGVRRAVREMNVHMIDIVTREKICEVKSVACALLRLDTGSVFALVPLDQIARPFAGKFRVL